MYIYLKNYNGINCIYSYSKDLDNVDIEFDDGIELRKNVELEVEKEAKKDILETTKTEKDLKRLLGKDDDVQENENKKTKS